ncbi:MAG: aldehyde dehydrogenase family protein, partial [Chloroflexi bacterium]|nr:aldehyde dehydrogenase family protein [Chloroflexota bacterium]
CPTEGYFYPPTLFTNVSPAATIAQVEIFGPVLVSMSFRTPAEAVALANNTAYGLAASIWTEDINLAFDVARKLKCGTVWINSTNLFDAASGFGGYRESGFGREGGKEGLYEYLQPAHSGGQTAIPPESGQTKRGHRSDPLPAVPAIDRTPKLYIGGKQVRPDSGYSRLVHGPGGAVVGEVGEGNRKDIRNAVEAAHAATRWADTTGHNRAQILYYVAENLAVRAGEFTSRLSTMTGATAADGQREVEASIERLFTYAAWADKYDGRVHHTPYRTVTLAMPEPLGVIGIVCGDDRPLLGVISLLAPAIALGNAVVIVPSERHPLSATDLYQVLETSDVSAGVVNIVTGARNALAAVLAEHDDVDGIWYVGDAEGVRAVEYASATNMKRTWTHLAGQLDWLDRGQGEGQEFLRECTQVKNIWSPYGV